MAIKRVHTKANNLVTVEVDSESDISSVGTDYDLGSSLYVTGIRAQYILTQNGWEQVGGGSGGGALVVNMTYDEATDIFTLDKTAGEIYEACPFVVAVEEGDGFTVYQLRVYSFSNDEGYLFIFAGEERLTFNAASADDYPTTEEPGGGGD